jgi:3-oxoacyl-ACP reductase-like protein
MARTEQQLNEAEKAANNRLQKAQRVESESGWDTEERRIAHEEVTAALDELAAVQNERRDPSFYEEEVQLVGPAATEVLPRSVAERLASEFGYYEIKPLGKGAK